MKKRRFEDLPEIPELEITEDDLQEDDVQKYKDLFAQLEREGFYDYDRPVDKTLIEYIKQNGLSDDDFFKYITESPRYLSYEPFLKKILKWQEILYRDHHTDSDKFKAKEKLKKIGFFLSYEGSGRRTDDRLETGIFLEYHWLMKDLSSVVDEMNASNSPGNRRLIFKERCNDYCAFSDLVRAKETPNGLARRILAKKHGKSARTIDRIITENIEILKRTIPYSQKKE